MCKKVAIPPSAHGGRVCSAVPHSVLRAILLRPKLRSGQAYRPHPCRLVSALSVRFLNGSRRRAKQPNGCALPSASFPTQMHARKSMLLCPISKRREFRNSGGHWMESTPVVLTSTIGRPSPANGRRVLGGTPRNAHGRSGVTLCLVHWRIPSAPSFEDSSSCNSSLSSSPRDAEAFVWSHQQ